jgi:uncharacterized protein YgiM (DUF1202 family)
VTRARASVAAAALVVLRAGVCAAAGTGEPEAFARVVVNETDVRAGPGVSHRVIHRAARGDALALETRGGSGYWLQVLLPDGRVGWVLGDTVEPVAVEAEQADAPSRPGLFAPPALASARGGFALVGGVLDASGYTELKAALLLAPAIALEPHAGIALTPRGQRALYGGGATLHLAPDWAVAPYVHLGAGGLSELPNEEAFPLAEQSHYWHVRVGAGLLVSFRWRILVRAEAMSYSVFTADTYRDEQGYVGGLGAYF